MVVDTSQRLELIDEDQHVPAICRTQPSLLGQREMEEAHQDRADKGGQVRAHLFAGAIDQEQLFLSDEVGKIDGRAWLTQNPARHL